MQVSFHEPDEAFPMKGQPGGSPVLTETISMFSLLAIGLPVAALHKRTVP